MSGHSASDEGPEIPPHECWARLRSQEYGRLAVTAEDGPMIYAINAVVDHSTLLFRTADGSKLDALRQDDRVAFEIDGFDADTSEAWSVVIRGVAQTITDASESVAAVEVGLTPWQSGSKPTFVRIIPDSIAGVRFTRTDTDVRHVDDSAATTPTPPD